MYIKYPHRLRRNMTLLVLGATCLTASFFIGIQTSGNMQPVSLIEAGGTAVKGDLNGSGDLDIEDIILILETANGYRKATAGDMIVDPNADGALTIDDALWVASILSLR